MYPAYTPMLRSNEITEKQATEEEKIEAMEEVIETQDAYRIVCTEFDMGVEGIRSLVSMTRLANNSEKVKREVRTLQLFIPPYKY